MNKKRCTNRCDEKESACFSRRDFLLGGGVTATSIILASIPGSLRAKNKAKLRVAGYPRKKIGSVSDLQRDKPHEFLYPHEHPNCTSFIVKLGKEAAGGVGREKDIVAFSSLCTHMGGSLSELYRPEYQAVGPCPMHLSVFDLRRHGMVVSGHGTEDLPQVVLELDGDDIYAVGVMGLLYGFSDNRIVS